jgi:hypothetical protein
VSTASIPSLSTVTPTTLAAAINLIAPFTTFPCTVTGPTGGPWVVSSPVQNGVSNFFTAAWTGGTGTITNNFGTIKLATVQSCDIDESWQAVPLMTSAQESQYAIDTGFHNGKASLKITVKDVNQIAESTLLGLTGVSAGGFTTYTRQATTKPAFVRAEFYGLDTSGKSVTWVATKAYAPGYSTSVKLADFADRQFDFDCLADAAATGSTTTYGIPIVAIYQQ